MITMILDFIILRSGVPLFSINFDPTHGLSHDQKKFTLISGFFSAISSFVDSMDNLGQMDEIQMSSDVFFTFKRVVFEAADLLFIVCSTNSIPKSSRKGIIEDAANEFMARYSENFGEKWNGNTAQFNGFNDAFLSVLRRHLQPGEEGPEAIAPKSEAVTEESYGYGQEQASTPGVMALASAPAPVNQKPAPLSTRFQKYQTLQFFNTQQQQMQQQPGQIQEPGSNAFSSPLKSNISMPWACPEAWSSRGLIAPKNEAPIPTGSLSQTRFIRYPYEPATASNQNLYAGFSKRTEGLYFDKAEAANLNNINSPFSYNDIFDIIPTRKAFTVEAFRHTIPNDQLRMLFMAIDGRKSIADIACHMGSDPQNILDACSHLESLGLIGQ